MSRYEQAIGFKSRVSDASIEDDFCDFAKDEKKSQLSLNPSIGCLDRRRLLAMWSWGSREFTLIYPLTLTAWAIGCLNERLLITLH